MRHIHVEEGLRLRFPDRGEAFAQGVEIGLLCAAMAAGQREFTRTLASDTLEQARALAAGMHYRVHVVRADDAWTEVMFLTGARRPRLVLVQGGPVERAC